jgi:ethanolaminephosphotransferase
LDAVDGKQARRTNQSSPLGQLFDHGCDAINSSLICFLYCQNHLLGPTSWPFYTM